MKVRTRSVYVLTVSLLVSLRVAWADRPPRHTVDFASVVDGEIVVTMPSGERVRTGVRATEVVADEVLAGERVVTVRDRSACVEETRQVRFTNAGLEARLVRSRGLRALAKHDLRGALRAFASAVALDPSAVDYRWDLARARLLAEGEVSAVEALGPLDVSGMLSLAVDDELGRLAASRAVDGRSALSGPPLALSVDVLRGREVGVFFSVSRGLLAVIATQARAEGLAPYVFLDVHDVETARRVARVPLSWPAGVSARRSRRPALAEREATRARRLGLVLGRLGFIRLSESDMEYASPVTTGNAGAALWTFPSVAANLLAEPRQLVLTIDGAARVVAVRDSAFDKVVEVVRIPRIGLSFVQLMTNELEGCVQDTREFATTRAFRFVVGTAGDEGKQARPDDSK
jgi:hypothetical protein